MNQCTVPRAARRMTQLFFDNGVLNLSVGMNRQEWCGWNRKFGPWVGHAEPDVGGAAVRSVLGGTVDIAHMEIWICENFGRLKLLDFFGGWNSFADTGLMWRRCDVGAASMNGKSEGNRMACGIDGDPPGKWETRGKSVWQILSDFAPVFASFDPVLPQILSNVTRELSKGRTKYWPTYQYKYWMLGWDKDTHTVTFNFHKINNWLDIGNTTELNKTREYFNRRIKNWRNFVFIQMKILTNIINILRIYY